MRCPSGIMWLMHESGAGPAVFRYDRDLAIWIGGISTLSPGDTLGDGWRWCQGDARTTQPRDRDFLVRLNQIDWAGYPEWFFDMYTAGGASSR